MSSRALKRSLSWVGVAVALVPFFTIAACGGDKAAPPPAPPAARGAAAAASVSASASASAGPTVVEFSENDFVEGERNRDPFRSYVSIFVETRGREAKNQRKVLLGQYSIDELKLVAIVLSGDYPRAMLLDPAGKGWVVKKGDFLGRPEVVHTGGSNGADYQLNWRVDKVRDGDLVLVREDPAQPGIAPATRVLPLHTEAEKAPLQLD